MLQRLITAGSLLLISCSGMKTEDKVYSDLVANNVLGSLHSIEETNYNCDDAGNITSQMECCNILIRYNEDGNMVRQTLKDNKGNIMEEQVCRLHENGLRAVLEAFHNGKKVAEAKRTIDDKGRYVSETSTDSLGRRQGFIRILSMNDFGQWKDFVVYDKDSTMILKEESVFDKNLLKEAKQTNAEGQTIASYKFTYNSKNELTEELIKEYIDNNERLTHNTYAYPEHDKNGNWTIRVKRNSANKAVEVVKRSLTYG